MPSFEIRTIGWRRECTEGNRVGRVIAVMVKVVVLEKEKKEEDGDLLSSSTLGGT